jgi:hypothetical protein
MMLKIEQDDLAFDDFCNNLMFRNNGLTGCLNDLFRVDKKRSAGQVKIILFLGMYT